ncbi:MAG: acetylglutamate kinase [Rectinemataceae bacterium]
MTIPDNVRADILIQAMPYFRKFAGKTFVVKYGGAAMVNEGVRNAVAQDLVLMRQVGMRPVLVHGGGPEIDKLLARLGKERVFVDGLRYTDEETMEVVQMVLSGKVNKDLVALIQRQGGKAAGLCGVDGGLFRAQRYAREGRDLGLVGEIDAVNPEIISALLDKGFIPVVSTVAMGESEDAALYNVNADTAAAELAGALGAEKLLLLTDVAGILEDLSDLGTLMREVDRSQVPGLIARGVVKGGMIPKVECCVKALELGVQAAAIIDGRAPHALLVELFSDQGAGTMIV